MTINQNKSQNMEYNINQKCSQKYNLEVIRFIWKYIVSALVFILVIGIYDIFILGYFDMKVAMLMLISGLFAAWIFYLCIRELRMVYRDIAKISDYMVEVVNGDYSANEKLQSIEDYKEGTVGLLYSNFDKMVQSLLESRAVEKREKIFLRDIISDISHQLKTPLASLNIFNELLTSDKVKDDEKKKQILSESKNQLDRMEWLVSSMLKLARIESGSIVFDKDLIELKPIIMQAVGGVKYLAEGRNQKINIICDDDIMINSDSGWLAEALINLLKNASDYSGADKPITVFVEKNNVYTRIYVKDEGPGISEADIPNIFKRFYRVNKEVNPNSVGIGLALTKSIVEGLGGNISVRSEVGKYTWFIMTFVK